MVGAGKSVLSSFAITQLRKLPSIELRVLHFFCKDSSPEKSTAIAIASSLIDQLIGQDQLSALFEILKAAHAKHAKSDTCTDFGILWDIFVAMVKNFPTRIVVVVDALDECNVDRVRFLDKLISQEMDDMDEKLRFFMASRIDHDIDKKLENHNGTLRLGMSVEEDIKGFVLRRLPELPRLKTVLGWSNKAGLKERIIQDVLRYADGISGMLRCSSKNSMSLAWMLRKCWILHLKVWMACMRAFCCDSSQPLQFEHTVVIEKSARHLYTGLLLRCDP